MDLKIVQVSGRSMTPYLKTGDVLRVASGQSEPLAFGQLYLLRSEHGMLVHRYVGAGQFKGDWNRALDKLTPGYDRVVGLQFKDAFISFENPILTHVHKVQGVFSQLSLKFGLGRLSFLTLAAFSWFIRGCFRIKVAYARSF